MSLDLISRRKFFETAPPWISAIASGVLIALSFVPWNFQLLAWIAWIPLIFQLLPINPEARCKQPFYLGFVTGLVFWVMSIYWLYHVTFVGMLALAGYLALYFGFWASGITWLRARWPEAKGWMHVLIALFGSAWWVSLEWIRGWALGGFPWNHAAVTQHQNLSIIQVCEWTGTYGVSFVIIFANIVLWLTFRRLMIEKFSAKGWRYEFSVGVFLIMFCLFFGFRDIRNLLKKKEPPSGTLRVALIQPNIPQDLKYQKGEQQSQQKQLQTLTLVAASAKPDLIIWPETALVEGPSFDFESREWLLELMRNTKVPLLFGTLDGIVDRANSNKDRVTLKYFNAAALVYPDGTFSSAYHKIHLVPFGEYIPWEKRVPLMKLLSPIPGSFESGDKPILFDFKGAKLGTLICFEDTFSYLSRDLAIKDADILINLTNDGWFKESHEAAMHAANAVFRAVETRRPLIRCTNHGLTIIVGPKGEILSSLKPFADGFQTTSLDFYTKQPLTLYTRYGDWFAFSCIGLSVLGLGMSYSTHRKSLEAIS
jgi:apolipoprotein N-acyltransferase